MEAPPLPTGKSGAQLAPLWKRVLRTAAATVLGVYLLGIPLAMIFEDKFIYFPTSGGVGPSPGEEVWLTARDGVKIHGWYLPHPHGKATILHLHGNAGNLEDRRDLVEHLRDLGASVMAIDFRGYGKSEGKPSEAGLYADSLAAYEWLRSKTAAENIILHGESLGAGPACELAATVPCGGLVVQSAFTSVPDMAPRVLPLFPKWFVRTRYDNLAKVARIPCRKLFIHSRQDEMIPFDMGTRLYAAAREPKECEWFQAAGHNDLTISQPRKYYSRWAKFLEPFGT